MVAGGGYDAGRPGRPPPPANGEGKPQVAPDVAEAPRHSLEAREETAEVGRRPHPDGFSVPEPVASQQFRPTSPDLAPSAWSQIDSLRSADLVPQRKTAPGRGWRKAVYRASFGTINLGPSRDERAQAELEERARALLRGTFKIGVFGRGGAGKTATATALGSTFAGLRQNDRVVAMDADTAFGKLGARVDPEATGSYWELVADRHLDSFNDVRTRVGANQAGLFVLAGESATARRRVLDSGMYRAAARALDRHFGLFIIDCSSTMDADVTREVLADLDAAVVVSSPWMDGGEVALQTLSWLANNGHTALLNRTVAVINDSDGHSNRRTRAVLAEEFTSRGNKVIEIPFDEHLRHGAVIDLDELAAVTRRRVLELAATLADYFASTTEAPRRRG